MSTVSKITPDIWETHVTRSLEVAPLFFFIPKNILKFMYNSMKFIF